MAGILRHRQSKEPDHRYAQPKSTAPLLDSTPQSLATLIAPTPQVVWQPWPFFSSATQNTFIKSVID